MVVSIRDGVIRNKEKCMVLSGVERNTEIIEEKRSGKSINPSIKPWMKRKFASIRREEIVRIFSISAVE
jgi:hypothetical protein